MDIKKLLKENNITPDKLKDQFFLTDEKLVKKIIESAELKKSDVVLEIGAGVGNITFKIAKVSEKVISFEIDKSFKPLLNDLPKNVDIRFEDAWGYIKLKGKEKKKREFCKIVANIPYSFAEKLLHNLTFLEYEKVIIIIPQILVKSIKENPVFSIFFNPVEIIKVPKEKFYPIPRTNSVIIDLQKLTDPIECKDKVRFLKQYLYQHEENKIKNSLREGLIKYDFLTTGKRLSKNEAKSLIGKSGIDKNLLEQNAHNSKIYLEISEKFSE